MKTYQKIILAAYPVLFLLIGVLVFTCNAHGGVTPPIVGNAATDSVWVEFAVNDTLGNATNADSVWLIRFYRQWVVDSVRVTSAVRTGFYRRAFKSSMDADSLGGYSISVRAFGASGRTPHTVYSYTVIDGGPAKEASLFDPSSDKVTLVDSSAYGVSLASRNEVLDSARADSSMRLGIQNYTYAADTGFVDSAGLVAGVHEKQWPLMDTTRDKLSALGLADSASAASSPWTADGVDSMYDMSLIVAKETSVTAVRDSMDEAAQIADVSGLSTLTTSDLDTYGTDAAELTTAFAGAVGSVTGNVGGNVTGSVGSVVGAVGSVTGAVGSVTGAVGSVTAAVTVDTIGHGGVHAIAAEIADSGWILNSDVHAINGDTTVPERLAGFTGTTGMQSSVYRWWNGTAYQAVTATSNVPNVNVYTMTSGVIDSIDFAADAKKMIAIRADSGAVAGSCNWGDTLRAIYVAFFDTSEVFAPDSSGSIFERLTWLAQNGVAGSDTVAILTAIDSLLRGSGGLNVARHATRTDYQSAVPGEGAIPITIKAEDTANSVFVDGVSITMYKAGVSLGNLVTVADTAHFTGSDGTAYTFEGFATGYIWNSLALTCSTPWDTAHLTGYAISPTALSSSAQKTTLYDWALGPRGDTLAYAIVEITLNGAAKMTTSTETVTKKTQQVRADANGYWSALVFGTDSTNGCNSITIEITEPGPSGSKTKFEEVTVPANGSTTHLRTLID